MPRTVILVPRRPGPTPDRDRIWSFVRSWVAHDFPDWPIFEGRGPDGPFNRSAAINEAADLAGQWDAAVIIDADTILDPGQVVAAVGTAMATGGPILAYEERVHLNKEGTGKVLAGYRGNWRRYQASTFRNSCSGGVVVTRELWDAVGGFDECFIGWGWEDVAFRCATELISGRRFSKIGGQAFHLHHVVSSGNNPDEPTFQENKARGERYKRALADGDRAAMAELLDEAGRARRPLPPRFARETLIPRIIHRTVPETVDPEVEKWWRAAVDLHPGWDLRTYRDPLDPADWPETGDLWHLCKSGAQRAGLIRLEALFRDGGIYLDSDVEVYRPLDPLLACEAFAGWEDPKVVPDAVLGSKPAHPAFAMMLERARVAIEGGAGAWASGPGVTTSTLVARPDVLLLPPGSFYPYHYTEKEKRRHDDHATAQPWAFGAHHWRHSWAGR